MTAIFRDELGVTEVSNITNIQYYKDDIWSIMYADYETDEIKGELIEVVNE